MEEFDENSFIESLKMIYGETPESDEGLWEIAIKRAWNNLGKLMEVEAFVDLLKENPDIGVDILNVASQPAQETPQPAAPPQCICPAPYVPSSVYPSYERLGHPQFLQGPYDSHHPMCGHSGYFPLH
jgi:hypothetical protein